MRIELEVTGTDLDGMIVTAVEGGINYWAKCREYQRDALEDSQRYPEGCSVQLAERDDEGSPVNPGWHKINREVMGKGLQVMAVKYPHQLRAFLASGSPGNYAPDAEVCDVVVQCGIFGELVYG